MLKNYLTIAIRNLMRYKAYSFINIAGLATGMACCALISLYILHELSYDRIHSKGDRIYHVLREAQDDEGNAKFYMGISGVFTPALIQDFPEVEEGMRFAGTMVGFVQSGDAIFEQSHAYAVEPNFFRIFDYPLIRGDRETALLSPYSVVITEEIARQYFGDTDPIGKVITFTDGRFPGDYTVTGVVHRSENTSIQFEMLCSLHSTTIKDNYMKGHWENWQTALNAPFGTFVMLRAGVNPKEIEKKLPDFIERQTGREARERNVYHLQPLHRLHLYTGTDYGSIVFIRGLMGVHYGNIQTIYLVSAIAFLMMLIACVNFMNLATARSANRAREVGLRKVSGAYRLQLVRQFLGEAVLLSSLSFVLALGLVELTLPVFGEFIGKDITPESSVYHVLIFGALAVVVGILAGIYPAFFLSAFEPVAVLKGQLKMGLKGAFLRKGLVVFQFAVSILLIIGTLMVYRQVHYMQNKLLGFQPSHLVEMEIFWYDNQKKRYEPASERLTMRYNTVKEAFLAHPNVLNATAYMLPLGGNRWVLHNVRTETDDTFQMMIQAVDEDFLATYEIDLIAGRPLYHQDMVGGPNKALLNETAVRAFGWKDPVGKQISLDNYRGNVTIIGVVKDFHNQSLRENIHPLILLNRYTQFYALAVRIKTEDVPTTIAFLEQTWKQFLPDRPFKFSFVDERLNQLYHEDQRVGKVVGIFALLTIVVACLGLFGLAAFTAEQRTKEIGIRKVLGASVSSIVLLLSKEFAGLVLIANLMAWPAAYFAVNHWLQNFAYRVDVAWWIFAFSGMAALLIALGTIGFQAIRAALANPIDALRYE